MSKLQVYSIRDSAVGTYSRPFFVPTLASAVRAVMRAMDEADSDFGAYPEHFSLWELGKWDDENGEFVAVSPIHVVNFVDLEDRGKRDVVNWVLTGEESEQA